MFSELQVTKLRRALAGWYSRHQRDLPWRRTRNPYAIWVSEIMLQQTTVATVQLYYGRFLRKFPTVEALARAPLEDVLKVWEGMGYYTRARNLHRAAKRVVNDFGGKLPASTQELLGLSGIGRYTAGAIASIAFGRDEPVLDGNVIRVFCRLFRVRQDSRSPRIHKRLWALAEQLLPAGQAGLFNQALMDLGATVCVPRNARCENCPLKAYCEAFAMGEQDVLPVRRPRKPIPHYDVAGGIIRKGGRILIDRRKPEGLLGGLWEFPGGKCKRGESLKKCLLREVREELNVKVEVSHPLCVVEHAYSHFRVTLHVFECRYVSGRPKALGCASWRWVSVRELGRYAFPSANRKIFPALQKARVRNRL